MTHPLDYHADAVHADASLRAMRVSTPLLTVLTILFAWAPTFFSLVLLPLPVVFASLLLVRRRWGMVALSAALSPMSVGFVVGGIRYATGSARLEYMGLPGTGFYNLDPDLRCETSTGGCLTNGGEILTQGPNNFAVLVLTHLFGPQAGAYTGPYPSESQAKTALASAVPISLDLLFTDQVDVTQPPVKLDVGVGSGLLKRTQLAMLHGMLPGPWARQQLDEYGPPRAALYQKTCLILRIPEPDPASAMIVLLDTTTGRPFAYYGEGEFHQRFPPVTWRK